MMYPVFQATSMNMIKSSEVTVGDVEERKVGDQLEYLAKLYRKDGRKIEVNTPFIRMKSLTFDTFQQDVKFVQVPMTQWLSDQVRLIERAVESQVQLPEDIEHLGVIMKRMFCGGDTTNIVTSKFIKFIPCDSDGNKIIDDLEIEAIQDTDFSFKIEFPHVYMGTHKNGQTVSCSARVTAIRYKRDVLSNEADAQINDETEDEVESENEQPPKKLIRVSTPKPKAKRLNAAK